MQNLKRCNKNIHSETKNLHWHLLNIGSRYIYIVSFKTNFYIPGIKEAYQE
jgi:hypothetical protein